MAHAPSKLLTMHSAVPNTSSRMVFQSRLPSLPTGTDLAQEKSSSSSYSSSSGDDSSEPSQQLEPQNEAQHLLDMPDGMLESAAAITADPDAVPMAADPDAVPMAGTAGMPETPAMAGTASDADGILPVQQVEPTSQVRSAVKHFEQLTELQSMPNPAMQASVGVSKGATLRGGMRLAPLVIPPPDDLQMDQAADGPLPGAMHKVFSGNATVKAAADLLSKRQQQPAVQGATARNQAAIAAHQARLAALHQKEHSKQAHGFGSALGHAEPSAAQHRHSPKLTLNEPDNLHVQHSAASASKVLAPVKLKPALRKHSSVANLSRSTLPHSPKTAPPLRRFGSVTPAPAATTPRHSFNGVQPLSPTRQEAATSIAQIMQRNSSLPLQAAIAHKSTSAMPRHLPPLSSPKRSAELGQSLLGSPRRSAELGQSLLGSPKRSVELSLLGSTSRMSSLSSPAKSLDTDQVPGGASELSMSGNVPPSRRSQNRQALAKVAHALVHLDSHKDGTVALHLTT